MNFGRLRAIAKETIATCLSWSGVLWLLIRIRLRNRATVLMYHRVLPLALQQQSFSASAMFVTPDTFDRHIAHLRRKFHLVTLEQFVRLLEQRKPFPPRTCLITFDDGWHDNLKYALPVLARHRAPAALFVTTDVVSNAVIFWQERLTQLLIECWRARVPASALPKLARDEGVPASCESFESAKVRARALVTRLKGQPVQVARDMIGAIEGALASHGVEVVSPAADAFLSWDDIRRLRESGLFTIGSHGMTHTPITMLSPDAVRCELVNSRFTISERLGEPIDSFAFPNGDNDHMTCRLVGELGYRVAFTTRRGLVKADDNPHCINRVGIQEHSAATIPLLLCRMVGIF
jgi:peptidoglycan/xylan/chitin deacetylase (PgdA/CDA1 family)